jgi:cytochrome c biogenesis protein CcmG/thiol:disulfide interchange protein DsbE
MLRVVTGFIDWKRTLLLLPVLAALGVGLYFFAGRSSTASTPRASLLETSETSGVSVGTTKGRLARDFRAYSPQGELVTLGELRGKPVIVNFWATWCASCRVELPDLRDLQAGVGADALSVLAINVGERAGKAGDYLDDVDAPAFRAGLDPTLVVADAYGVRGMPQSVFIDSAGVIRQVYVGQLSREQMEEYLAATVAEQNAGDPTGPLRLVTTVARDHVLEIREPSADEVEFVSKRLRCDDSYCADAVIDALAAANGVLSIERRLQADPPAVLVRFESGLTTVQALTDVLTSRLEEHEDPLYDSPLQIEQR